MFQSTKQFFCWFLVLRLGANGLASLLCESRWPPCGLQKFHHFWPFHLKNSWTSDLSSSTGRTVEPSKTYLSRQPPSCLPDSELGVRNKNIRLYLRCSPFFVTEHHGNQQKWLQKPFQKIIFKNQF